MVGDVRTNEMSVCSHGGVYSVNPNLVRIDCSSSINPLGTPRKAIVSIQKSAKSLSPTYPDPECKELKKSLSRYLNIGSESIVVGNGAIEIIYWFAKVFAGKEVLIPAPTFCEYELASCKAGARPILIPLRNFNLDGDEMIQRSRGVGAIFLCNPNNPTGMLATEEIRKVIENVDNSTTILVDECFIELVNDPHSHTLIDLIEEFDNLVILRSLTKSFGLAGLRVGYCVCNSVLAGQLSANRIPWNVNGLAQAAGIAALADKHHLIRARSIIRKERKFLYDEISSLESFIPLRSDANYFLVDLQNRNSAKFRDQLLKKTGVLVRDCSTFTGMGSSFIRIAIRSHGENLKLLRALEEFDA